MAPWQGNNRSLYPPRLKEFFVYSMSINSKQYYSIFRNSANVTLP